MKIFDWYVVRNLFVATVFVAITLAVIIFLTQSLRFLELVIESGASSSSFWVLTFLALPRFFEVILPLSVMAATIFIYNRMTMDSELIAIRATGASPASLARPAIVMALIVTVFMWGIVMWLAPRSLATMQEMQQVIKSQVSSVLFRDGVFNRLGSGLTVYIRSHTGEGELKGLMIYDSREKAKNPSTIMAKKGVIVAKDGGGHQVLVFDGSRQEFDPESRTLHRLNFERYTIDLPEGGPVRERWQEPDERTIFELFNPDPDNERDMESLNDFKVEIHRRVTAPLLSMAFVLISCATLLLGPIDRRGQSRRIIMAILIVVILQGFFIAAYNIARQSDLGLVLMYLIVTLPTLISGFAISGWGEAVRRSLLFQRRDNKVKGGGKAVS